MLGRSRWVEYNPLVKWEYDASQVITYTDAICSFFGFKLKHRERKNNKIYIVKSLNIIIG